MTATITHRSIDHRTVGGRAIERRNAEHRNAGHRDTGHRNAGHRNAGHTRRPACSPMLIDSRAHDPLVRVSATTWGVDGEVRGMVRPRVPNYTLRRLVVATAAAVIVAIMAMTATTVAVGVLAGFGGAPASASEAPSASQGVADAAAVHLARAGDTLWSIADAHRGDIGHGAYVDALVRLNGGTTVQPGQTIWLP